MLSGEELEINNGNVKVIADKPTDNMIVK